MQESQYVKQQRYMEATAEERHNFRQTIRILENLSREEDNTAIRKYLMDYVSTMPKNDMVSFCTNHAVNALLNYYAESADNLKADTYLCIVMTNPFHGKLHKSKDNYLSTRRNGSGIGLSSVRSIAEQYGGVAKFSDKDGEFFSDVMMRVIR